MSYGWGQALAKCLGAREQANWEGPELEITSTITEMQEPLVGCEDRHMLIHILEVYEDQKIPRVKRAVDRFLAPMAGRP